MTRPEDGWFDGDTRDEDSELDSTGHSDRSDSLDPPDNLPPRPEGWARVVLTDHTGLAMPKRCALCDTPGEPSGEIVVGQYEQMVERTLVWELNLPLCDRCADLIPQGLSWRSLLVNKSFVQREAAEKNGLSVPRIVAAAPKKLLRFSIWADFPASAFAAELVNANPDKAHATDVTGHVR
jgi:hypothetical protein